MENLDGIKIEGKELAYSKKDINKLTSADGCELKVVTDKVLELDDAADSDAEDADLEIGCASRLDKVELMRREYLSIILNANRDHVDEDIKPSVKVNKFLANASSRENYDDDAFVPTHQKQKPYTIVHERYENLGPFNERLEDEKYSYIEISPGRVFKRTLCKGVGNPVTENALVIYNCALWAENSNKPFDSSWLRGTTIFTNLATDPLISGLYELFLTTNMGEVCEAIFTPAAAFGKLGAMPRIPPEANIFCLLEVVRVIPAGRMSVMQFDPNIPEKANIVTFEDLYEAAQQARKRGNYYYNNEQFRLSLQRYKSGIRILDAVTYKDEVEEKKGMELMLKLYNNTARAANALKIPRLALSACKQALDIDNRSAPTYWQKMNAWAIKGHLDKALGTAQRALQLFQDKQTVEQFRKKKLILEAKLQEESLKAKELEKLMGKALLKSY